MSDLSLETRDRLNDPLGCLPSLSPSGAVFQAKHVIRIFSLILIANLRK